MTNFSYQQQHQLYVKHATNQIAVYENEKQKLEQQQQSINLIPPQILLQSGGIFGVPPNFPPQSNFNLQQPPPQIQFNLPPQIPDLSRPPPNFITSAVATNEIAQQEAPPLLEEPDPQPYFTLPAGLMVSLVQIEDSNYQPLEPDLVKLPRPGPPTEKVIKAIEAFYASPSHDRVRDLEGWEKLGLYEYFKTKNAFRKQKEEAIERGERKKSNSPSPIPEHFTRHPKKSKKRVYQSKSPEIRDVKCSKSKSTSRSPTPERPAMRPRESRSRKRSRSPSPPPYHRNFSREPRKRRSVTPPSFGATLKNPTEFIDEGNKGHQMLKKLGWTSGGLGKNQGISEPISGGEVRDRHDQYKVCI